MESKIKNRYGKMRQTNFWNDAAWYGVYMALLAIVFDIAGFYTQHALLSLLSLLLFVGLLTWFTKCRVARYATDEEGYGYGRCLGFIVAVMLCAGFIEGAFVSVAANWLFAAKYDASIAQSISLLEETGFYTADMLEQMTRWLHSPLWLILGTMFGSAVKGAFFGLFIAAFARREARPFANNNPE